MRDAIRWFKCKLKPPNNFQNNYAHSAMVDETYLSVASHVEQSIVSKIAHGEYVDFSRLIAKDKVLLGQDDRIKIVNKDGHPFFVPVRDNLTSINSFGRWEQAFRVFSEIYSRHHPHRSSELIQYNHIIHTAAMTYVWENVYLYDIDFHFHIGKHPQCSWAIILQQAWSMRLREKLNKQSTHAASPGLHNNNNNSSREPCWCFNKGRCTYGKKCKFEHKCMMCNKYGHGTFNCRCGGSMHQRRDDRDKNERSGDRHQDHDRQRNCEGRKSK